MTHVICADHDQHQVRTVFGDCERVGDNAFEIIIRVCVTVSGKISRRSDDRTARAFMKPFRKSGDGGAQISPGVRERDPVRFEERLQEKPPGSVGGAIVGDRVAHGHDLHEIGPVVIGEHEIASRHRRRGKKNQAK